MDITNLVLAMCNEKARCLFFTCNILVHNIIRIDSLIIVKKMNN